jgi:bacterioferritin
MDKQAQHSGSFSMDTDSIRKRARVHIENGAVTEGYRGSREAVIKLLNDLRASELVCVLRYKRHYFMASAVGGVGGHAVVEELAEHAKEEEQHADWLAERIVQLGGEPDFNPDSLSRRALTEYVEGKDLASMLREDLVGERVVIDAYRQMITYVGEKDPTTRRLFERILESEEEHADELADLLRRVGV